MQRAISFFIALTLGLFCLTGLAQETPAPATAPASGSTGPNKAMLKFGKGEGNKGKVNVDVRKLKGVKARKFSNLPKKVEPLGEALPRTPKEKARFHCDGDNMLDLSQRVIEVKEGAAVVAEGNCKLVINGSVLSAPVVIELRDKATAQISSTNLSGEVVAVRLFDDARLEAKSSNIQAARGLDAVDRTRAELSQVVINGSTLALNVQDKGVLVLENTVINGKKVKGRDASIVVRDKK